jgi:peptidoglycan/xylan/chitin deacetylase (PgdA/CDA1 family)
MRGQKKLLYVSYIIFFEFVLSIIIVIHLYENSSLAVVSSSTSKNSTYSPCTCVIFRLDDIDDSSKSKLRSTILDHFISENKKLVTAIILSKFGNMASDGTVYAKVKQGYDKGLFQLAIHGWNHDKYTELTEEQQKKDFINANNKLLSLFGNKSRIFAPPFNEFNSYTISAMANSGLDILSSSSYREDRATNPYKVQSLFSTSNSKIQLSEVNSNGSDKAGTVMKTIHHIPLEISLLSLIRHGYSGEDLVERVLSDVDKHIAKRGYSVIALHPSDFSTTNSSVEITVDPNKFQVLVDIMDRLENKGISIVNFEDITRGPFRAIQGEKNSTYLPARGQISP